MRPTGHVPPANAAKQEGRKYVWRHLPLRGSRGRHFTVFQSQPPGRQPFGLKVESPRLPPAGRPPSRRGGLGRQAPSPPRGPVEARIRPRIERQAGPTPPAGWLSLRRTAHSFTRGPAEAWNRPRNQWRAKPEPPCTACRLRGVQGPPRSIFGHFLLIKKVATPASGFCLTNSQTTALPMAQSKES